RDRPTSEVLPVEQARESRLDRRRGRLQHGGKRDGEQTGDLHERESSVARREAINFIYLRVGPHPHALMPLYANADALAYRHGRRRVAPHQTVERENGTVEAARMQ